MDHFYTHVHRLADSDCNQMLRLINCVQPTIPWTAEHLRWQFFATPAGPANLYGITDGQLSLVSFYSAVAQRVKIGNRIISARMVQDVMTHPDHRGQGFLHQLAERCLQDIIQSGEVAYTFPNEKSENSFRRTGWHELCRVPLRKKTINPRTTPALEATEIIGPFDDVVSSIWESSALPIGVHRDAAYLNWRYSKPATQYFKFVTHDAKGLIVLKLYQDTLHICELLTVCPDGLQGMLQFGEAFGSLRGAALLTAWLPEAHAYSEAFDRFGLGIQESGRYIFVYPGQNQVDEFTNPNRWHLTQGDSDIY